MPAIYNFKKITVVPSAADLKEIVLSKTQRKTPTVVHRHFAISRIRSFYTRKIKFLQQVLHDKLTQIIDEFPKMEEVHPFYADLMNILYDKDHYKIALGQMNTARHLIDGIAREYVRLMKYGDSLYRCKMLKRAALGRMVKLLKHQKSSFDYLEQVRQHLSRLPTIDPNTRTLILCGFPNVGKSSLMNLLTRADVEVQPYAFTTKSLYVGHLDYKYLRWQVIDTPGILDQPLEERNTIEMQAITALAHLRAAVLFIMDISETCDHTIEEQVALFESIRPLFVNKPVLIGLNKIDIVKRDELKLEKMEKLKKLEDDSLSMFELSTVTQEGIMDFRNTACNYLLTQRVESKLQSRKLTVEDGVLSRVFVAYPVPRDDKERPPFIPEAVVKKRILGSNNSSDEKTVGIRKLERQIELEMQDEYVLDLKKHYLLKNDVEKYDVVPEIWEGHNIADFVASDVKDMLESIRNEEEAKIQAGFYDEDLDLNDDETKKLFENAKKIVEKESQLKMASQAKKSITKPRLSRSVARKRDRNMMCLEEQFRDLGADIHPAQLKNMAKEQMREPTVKKIRVGKSPSLVASRPPSRDVQGIKNDEVREMTKKVGRKKQRNLQHEARKGEADRHIFILMRQKENLADKDNVIPSRQKKVDYSEEMGTSWVKFPRKQHRPWRNKVRKKAAKEAKRKLREKKDTISSGIQIMQNKKKSRIRKTNYPNGPSKNVAVDRQEMNSREKKIDSSLFRYINEQLYTMNGAEAMELFRKDSKAFKLYHKGYQMQAKKWPCNPLHIIIQWIRSLKRDGLVIADLGCGNATIAETLSHTATVHSFDLVAVNDRVTACDMSMVYQYIRILVLAA
ncbi:GTP-binding domain protein [Onchocerca flexuosa]|uniref:Ribosomal RNA-processing protein 8 n=1 Tax=Onchocerca flexuosa TaxID=387005 RepID=A0A238BJ11_9BILA|nr:GTP-binding domain protein [Onchocerca flexuosa]